MESEVNQFDNVGLYTGIDAALTRQLIYAGARLGIYKKFEEHAK